MESLNSRYPMVNEIRVRFAPSPTGHLHIGSARTALFNWLFARNQKGAFILRVEDTDIARSTKEFEQSILSDLGWLGLDYDELFHQSQRFDLYRQKAHQLLKENKAYYCYCTPEELQIEKKKAMIEGRPARYSGRCKKISSDEAKELEAQGRKPAIRFGVKGQEFTVNDLIYAGINFDLTGISDFIILRPDGSPTFHLAVVVDDGEMQISHVIRGEDHLSNTPKHILLFQALGYETPRFAHIPIILGPDKSKLSKRHGATAIADYRKQGFLSQAMVNYLSLLSWSPPTEQEIYSPSQLTQLFSLERVSKSPAIFDIDKLKWLNGQHIRMLTAQELASLIEPYLAEKNMKTSRGQLVLIAAAIKEDLVTLSEAADYAAVFFQEVKYPADVTQYLKEDFANKAVANFKNIFSQQPPKSFEEAKNLIKIHSTNMKPLGIKGKNAFMPLRLALTGSYSGPELYFLVTILEKDKVIERFNKALEL